MNSQASENGGMNKGSFVPQSRPQRAAWVKRNKRALQLLRAVIVGLSAVTVILGLLLILLPAFKVKEIVVKGNSVTATEEIVSATGVSVGDEIVGLDLHEVIKSVQGSCPVQVVSARVTLSKLVIEVSEREVMYTAYADRWFSLDKDLNVVDVSENEAEFSSLLKVSLPPIQRVTLQAPVAFCNSETDITYIKDMVEALDEMELTARVDLLDVSEKFNVSYVLDGNLRIVLGKVSELEEKHEMAEQILLAKGDTASLAAVIDVSDVKKSTYRPVTAIELLA